MRLSKTAQYSKNEKRFFKQHKELLPKYREFLKKLQSNPFEPSLKTHKLKGGLSKYYSCYLTYEYRIVIAIKIVNDEVILMNIGTHNEVY